VHARSERDVIKNGLWKRIWPLKHHADAGPHLCGIDIRRVDVLSVEQDLSIDADPRHVVEHAVQAAQKRGLAASGWTDDRGNAMFRNLEGYRVEGQETAVVNAEVLDE